MMILTALNVKMDIILIVVSAVRVLKLVIAAFNALFYQLVQPVYLDIAILPAVEFVLPGTMSHRLVRWCAARAQLK